MRAESGLSSRPCRPLPTRSLKSPRTVAAMSKSAAAVPDACAADGQRHLYQTWGTHAKSVYLDYSAL